MPFKGLNKMGTYLRISQKGSLKHLETTEVFVATKHDSRNVAAFTLQLFQVVYILSTFIKLIHNRCLNVTSGIW